MDLHEENWILTIAEEQNITRAAEKLFVSPSALTQAVNRIEQDLGTNLFIRSRKGCFLTDAGTVYVEGIRRMLQLDREIHAQIHDVAENIDTELCIGFPPEHGGHMFAAIYPELRDAFPHIHFKIREASVRKQQAMIASGELDLSFLTLIDSQKTKDEYIPIAKEELLIALPTGSTPTKYSVEEKGSRFPVLDLSHLKDFPMATLYRESTFSDWADSIYLQAGIQPNVVVDTARRSTLLCMVATGLCGGLITDFHCQSILPESNISVFSLPSHPCWWFSASYRRGSYLSKPMKMLISLAKDYREKKKTYPEIRIRPWG